MTGAAGLPCQRMQLLHAVNLFIQKVFIDLSELAGPTWLEDAGDVYFSLQTFFTCFNFFLQTLVGFQCFRRYSKAETLRLSVMQTVNKHWYLFHACVVDLICCMYLVNYYNLASQILRQSPTFQHYSSTRALIQCCHSLSLQCL